MVVAALAVLLPFRFGDLQSSKKFAVQRETIMLCECYVGLHLAIVVAVDPVKDSVKVFRLCLYLLYQLFQIFWGHLHGNSRHLEHLLPRLGGVLSVCSHPFYLGIQERYDSSHLIHLNVTQLLL